MKAENSIFKNLKRKREKKILSFFKLEKDREKIKNIKAHPEDVYFIEEGDRDCNFVGSRYSFILLAREFIKDTLNWAFCRNISYLKINKITVLKKENLEDQLTFIDRFFIYPKRDIYLVHVTAFGYPNEFTLDGPKEYLKRRREVRRRALDNLKVLKYKPSYYFQGRILKSISHFSVY